jgi:dienelactone hydrolase
MRLLTIALLAGFWLLAAGCADDEPDITDVAPTGGQALFSPDPQAPALPFPTDLLFAGTQDGTLNVPNPDGNPVTAALNALDGFSTVAPIRTDFNAPLDPDSLALGDTVRVYEAETVVTPQGRVVVGVRRALGADELRVGISPAEPDAPGVPRGATMLIQPLRPLQPSSTYLVALSDDIRAAGGGRMVASSTYTLLKQRTPFVDEQGGNLMRGLLSDEEARALEPLRRLVNAQEAALESAGLPRGRVILSWTFTTQSVGAVLDVVAQRAATLPGAAIQVQGPVAPTPGTGRPGFVGADIYAGLLLGLPSYQIPASAAQDPVALLTPWQAAQEVAGERNLTVFNPLPLEQARINVPVLVTIPRGEKPADGWPVVIYVHGITRNRTDVLTVADVLANAGFAAIAIDLPWHGLTGRETNGTAAFRIPWDPATGTGERLFDVDMAVGATPDPSFLGDGEIDPSGTHFINLFNLLMSRDNLRQAAADLVYLLGALETLDYDGGGVDVNPARVHVAAQSLGSMVASVFLALEPRAGAAVLSAAGGGVAKVLDGSPTFGPRIAAALAGQGVLKGTQAYESFLYVAQAAVDSGDPLNYAPRTAAGRGLLVYEIVGGVDTPPDQVVPNNVWTGEPPFNMPGTVPGLGGTDPLVEALGLEPVDSSATGDPLRAVVRFTAGHHSSFLTPLNAGLQEDPVSAAVHAEMLGEMASFLASDGRSVAIGAPDLIEEVP